MHKAPATASNSLRTVSDQNEVRISLLEQELETVRARAQENDSLVREMSNRSIDALTTHMNNVRFLCCCVEELLDIVKQMGQSALWTYGVAPFHFLTNSRNITAYSSTTRSAALRLKDATLERMSHLDQEHSTTRLFQDYKEQYQTWIQDLFGIIREVENTLLWQLGKRVRFFLGLLNSKYQEFDLPTNNTKTIIEQFEQWETDDAMHLAELQLILLLGEHSSLSRSTPPPDTNQSNYTKVTKNSIFYNIITSLTPRIRQLNFERTYSDSELSISEHLAHSTSIPSGNLVTIIMPSYNRAGIILQAIQSIREQTYQNWELLVCDDGSNDDTESIVTNINDARIQCLKLAHKGAASARNSGLNSAKGQIIAYLDTDNIWHPAFLQIMVSSLAQRTGQYSAYCKYIDLVITEDNIVVKKWSELPFNFDQLSESNFIDLNSFIHRVELYNNLGGFTNALERQQDWDLVLKFTFLQDPIYVDYFLTIYRRNNAWGQLTKTKLAQTEKTQAIVRANLNRYYDQGVTAKKNRGPTKKVTIISWDICRNHFSKAFNLAECLSQDNAYDVQLIGFRFFETDIFEPYKDESPGFSTLYLNGTNFPSFEKTFAYALTQITGDIVYCIKPRLPSLGLSLLANYHFGIPIIMEANDSEIHVADPQTPRNESKLDLAQIDLHSEELQNPYSIHWSRIMDHIAIQLPLIATHNKNLNDHYGSRSFCIRNMKDQTFYDPTRYDRNHVRQSLGYSLNDRVILFGGLLRKHKGIFEYVKLVEQLADERYKLLFVASRDSPDRQKMLQINHPAVHILPPQGRNEMAKINYAADLVILWLDPNTTASHYQMPYKLTDALAMNVPVIANDVSDLGNLGRSGYLHLVKYGDIDALKQKVLEIFEQTTNTKQMVEAARKLYLRQFSYLAARSNFDIIYETAIKQSEHVTHAAIEFTNFYATFHNILSKNQEKLK